MKLNRKLAALLACVSVLVALLCGCNMRKPSAAPSTTPVHTPARTSGPTPAPTPRRALPSTLPGKTASQDTAGARTTIPEEAAGGQ